MQTDNSEPHNKHPRTNRRHGLKNLLNANNIGIRSGLTGNLSDTTGMQIRRFALILTIILIVSFITVHFIKSAHEKGVENITGESASAQPLVNVITVKPSPATVKLKLPGETAAWYESTIYARVDGYVAKWNADIGDHVKKGQVLATIETPDLDAQLNASLAKLKAAEAMIKARQAEADFAKTTYDRWKNAPTGVVSQQEREAKKAGYDSAIANLNEAEAQAALDKADVDRYTVLTKFKQVTAPYDGVITQRHIDIGNLVTSGSSSNTTSLYRMTQNNPIRVFIDVPQSAASDMQPETAVEITASNIPDQVFKGKITRTADALDQQSRTLKVEVDIPNPDQKLVPGMYVDVNFDIAVHGTLQVPAAALNFRSGGPQVAVVDSEHRVIFHKVSIIRDNGNTIEIGSGLTAGDQVVLNISNQIVDGEKVKIGEVR